ncbi:endonuclease [Lampropedia puyangensis]|uniref:Endonuclease n=1 Tax=Lampropedia puyangensis TaxID=1330072 RepID=A0A4S8FD66_9BURK|nr:endonuclease/exonuclease/phosphatase family protein [Lampropedia puyangensis]THU05287.1 endonuclease [Lampropedia puyangensis]
MNALSIAIVVFSSLLVVLTILPCFKSRVWWVRIWDFPRSQLATLLGIALLMQLTWLPPLQPGANAFPYWPLWLGITTFASLLYQLWWIMPYTPLWRKEVRWADAHEHGPRLKLMSANVLTPNRNTQALIALVQQHRPDILVTLETDAWWQQQLQPLEADYPFRMACPLDNLYGMHVYSRLPLSEMQTQFLVEDDVPSMHASLTLVKDLQVRVHFLHPAPPSPTENAESTERDIELLMLAKSLEKEEGPAIVAGDLNDVAWSPTTRLFRKLSGLLDPRVGRSLVNTFHAEHWFARWPLDHFFHSDHFELVHIARLPSIGSDHFPVMVELQYHPHNAAQQEGLQATPEDKQEAKETLQEHGAQASDVPEPTAQEQKNV